MACLVFDAIGVVIALLVILYTYYKWSYQYWKNKKVPYLEPQIPLGNIDPPLKKRQPFGDEVAKLYKQAKEKGWNYVGIYMFMRPIFMPLDLDLIKHIMTKDFNHFVDRGIYVNEDDEPIGKSSNLPECSFIFYWWYKMEKSEDEIHSNFYFWKDEDDVPDFG